MTNFVNRKDELDFLEDIYSSSEAELIVIHGKRRIGKSELARKSIKNLGKTVYYQATETTPTVQLEEFIEIAEKKFPKVKDVRRDWEPILRFLGEKGAIVIIDEFPYLIESDRSIPSKFQRIWDHELEKSNIKLVLIGSSISIMEDKVLSGGSPLHGRRTGQIDLKPLSFRNAMRFYPNFSPLQKVLTWSIFGGTPHYLKSLDNTKSMKENVEDLLLSQQGLLRDEPDFLLRTELKTPSRYMGILKSISKGKVSRNEIAQDIGLDGSKAGSYLSKLETLRLVEREVPVTEEPPKSRSGQYKVKEPLFRFWFRFIHGKKNRISLSDDPFDEIVKPEINDYVSPQFEQLCQKRLPELLSRKYKKIGRWWFGEEEIDVVGITERGKVLGECKFSDSKVGQRELTKLEEKENKIRLGGKTEHVLFSKAGFTPNLKKSFRERENVHLYELDEIVTI